VLADWPPGRRLAASALICVTLAIAIVTLLNGLSSSFLLRIVQTLSIAVVAVAALGALLALVTSHLADYREPSDEAEFERLVVRSERLAREAAAEEPDFAALDPHDPDDFEILVREALDDLPDLLLKALDHVPVVISDKGARHRAYGLYQGDTVARDDYPDRIVIFRDTLLRDFGHDADALRDQVTRTVRHELAHHLGADELGVRELGL
jgi:predicted Zn-dependent protease with MMP-like domain